MVFTSLCFHSVSAEATLAGVAQTAGDLMAAVAMQVIPAFVSNDYDPDELDCFRNWRELQFSWDFSGGIPQPHGWGGIVRMGPCWLVFF